MDDTTSHVPSVTERRLRRWVLPARGTDTPSERTDVIHDPDRERLWGTE